MRSRSGGEGRNTRHAFWRRAMLALVFIGGVALAQDAERRNEFGDPFILVTAAMAGCPVPEGPLLTHAEALAEAHARSQRGVSCFISGECRLANAYLYDKEIIPRVKIAIESNDQFSKSSIWALGQRRVVFLKGCVRSAQDREGIEQLVRRLDDVQSVVNQLMVGTAQSPPYVVEKRLDDAAAKPTVR